MDGRFDEVDGWFEELKKKMDGRFEEMEKRMDGRFKEMEKKMDRHESQIRDVKAELENAAAITQNQRISQMHQPINLIKVLKSTDDPSKFVWASHAQFPKHMKSIYILGQRAKGIFEPRWDGTPDEQSMCLKPRYLIRICFCLCNSSFT